MLRAEEQRLLIGWDVDPRIKLDPDADDGDHPNRLGDFILWLARRRPQLQIHVLMWNIGAVKLLGRGRAVLTSLRWARRRNITFKFDSAHRSEEHTSELQSLMRISYAVFCLKKKKKKRHY